MPLGVLIAVAVMIIGTILVAIFDPEFDTTAGKDAAQLMVALSARRNRASDSP